jgi:protein involved in polysaccharide export with SLBB domain
MPEKHDLTLAAALAEAGGLTLDADACRVKIVRRRAGGEQELIKVDASPLLRRDSDFTGPVLQENDQVAVARAESFSVIGEVHKPGVYSRKDAGVQAGQPVRLSHALAAAGGCKDMADRRGIQVVRTDAKGRRSLRRFNLDSALLKGDVEQDPVLEDGDQIVAAASEGVLILGQVRQPGIYYAVGGPLTVSRLVAMSGGFEKFAAKRGVTVVRKSDPGRFLQVDMKAIVENGKLEQDVELSAGDVVFVGETVW